MNFSTSTEGNVLTLKIDGELDAMSVAEVRPAIDKIVEENHRNVVVELGGLRMIDSSGVGAIVSLYKRVRAAGGTMTVRGVRDQPLAIFKLLRIDQILAG